MREAFRTESGDEFMSLVYMLDTEAEGADPAVGWAAAVELERMLTGKAPAIPAHEQPPASRPLQPVQPPASRPLQPLAPRPVQARPTVVPLRVRPAAVEPAPVAPAARQPAAPGPSTLVDELTGIGGPLALRRDVMLESSLPSPGGPRFALITIDVQPVSEVRQRRGPAVADQLFKTLVDAVRVSLRGTDSIYRSGGDELTLLLRGRDPGPGDHARLELEAALRTALAERGLPSVRLATAMKRARPAVAQRQPAAV